MTGVLHPPQDWSPAGPVMTNLGHRIDEGVAELLRAAPSYGEHSAWDFHGVVWFADGRWYETVSVHHQPQGTYSAGSLQELMRIVNDEHGWA